MNTVCDISRNDEILSLRGSARFIKVSPRTLSRYREERKIPALQYSSRKYNYRKSDLLKFLQERYQGTEDISRNDEILTPAESARFIKVSLRTLSRYCEEQKIPAIKYSSRKYNYLKSDLLKFLQERYQDSLFIA